MTGAIDAAQAIHALFRFLGISDAKAVEETLQQQRHRHRSHRKEEPLRAIQQPHEALQAAASWQATQEPASAQLQKAKKAAEGMTTELLPHQLQLVYNRYKGTSQRMNTAMFLHLLVDAHLLTNRFGVVEGQEVFAAAESQEQAGKKQKVTGLTCAGFVDALHRIAAVRFTKVSDLEEAYRRLLCGFIIPCTQQSPSDTALAGLFNSLEILEKCDTTLKKIFAWYASLPYLTGQVSWQQFRNTHKGIMAGHILMFLTDFKVVPGLLSVRQVTGVLQQHAAKAICSESTLQYPEMLEVLCECAVLLRQQVQRKLAGPWVNLTELNALKRFLKLQSMPSLQEAYSLPNSPKHIATITSGLQNVRLAPPPSPTASAPGAWPQFLPQHSRLTQRSTQQQAVAASSAQQSAEGQNAAEHGGLSQDLSQNSDWGGGMAPQIVLEHAAVDSPLHYSAQQSQAPAASAAGVIQRNVHVNTSQQSWHHRQHQSAVAARMQESMDANSIAQSLKQSRKSATAHAALQQGSDALAASADTKRPEWSNVTSAKGSDGIWGSQERVQPDVQHFEEEALAQQAAVQELACRKHLAGREAAKRRLLQHRMERLSSDPRMPARLATHPSHMACSMTPPYALLDSAATTPTTALNIDGDGWAPCVDLVALDQPPARQASGKDRPWSGTWGELPMQSLRRTPLDGLTTAKLGKRSRESTWADDSSRQVIEFESRLPALLNSWSIESERLQWRETLCNPPRS